MPTTAERWRSGRPILGLLPGVNGGYQNEVSDWLTATSDEVLHGVKRSLVDGGLSQVNPLTCDEKWLDLLAPLCGWQGYWDRNWPIASKRQLLNASYSIIWPNYGSAKTLGFVLSALGVTHRIVQADSFLIGRNKVGDPIGSAAWEYTIILPSSLFGSQELKLTKRINLLFGPIWDKSEIVFDDSYFAATGFPLIDDNTFLAVDEIQSVLRL